LSKGKQARSIAKVVNKNLSHKDLTNQKQLAGGLGDSHPLIST